jgi:protein gp37
MPRETAIAWTDSTFNPWWGCTKISPGCAHCYAATFAHRIGQDVWGEDAPRRFFEDKHWSEPRKWNAAAAREGAVHRVFCASMADAFEVRPDLDPLRERLWRLIEDTPALTWQLLTKRPENVREMVPPSWLRSWPAHAWVGCTIEDQQRVDERVPHLLRVPASVRFLSAEPLIEAVTIPLDGIAWAIVGGESGPKARPFDPAWARSIIAECNGAKVACFVKQFGCVWSRETGAADYQGADPAEWPEDLRVQRFPGGNRVAA